MSATIGRILTPMKPRISRKVLFGLLLLFTSACPFIDANDVDSLDGGGGTQPASIGGDLVAESHIASTFKLEGRVVSNELLGDELAASSWFTSTRVLINGGERLAFLREDGSFVVSGLPSGSYVVEVVNPGFLYEPARVEITSKGKIRARRVNLIQVSSVVQLPYPLRFKVKAPFKYFQIREQWRVTDFLFSPMVLMMVVPLLLIMVMPKLMNAADPDTQREMQQSLQGSNIEWPDMSEAITSWLGGGRKTATASQKAIKANKKRQS